MNRSTHFGGNAGASDAAHAEVFHFEVSLDPWREPSRPIPDCFTPPKSAASEDGSGKRMGERTFG